MPEELFEKQFFWTDEDIKKLPTLPEPVETFDLSPEESVTLRIENWGLYKHLIHPRFAGAPEEKLVLALRVWLYPEYRPPRSPYYDIHQGHLIRMLVPFLQEKDFRNYELTIIKHGQPPRAYFEVIPKKVA